MRFAIDLSRGVDFDPIAPRRAFRALIDPLPLPLPLSHKDMP